ncbi:MAG: kelch repeat-containing protein [Bacteroidota bacterium]
MKKILCFAAVIICFSSCKKTLLQHDIAGNTINIPADIQPVPGYTWKSMTALSNGNTGSSTLIQSGNNVYCVTSSGFAYKYNTSTKVWEAAPVQQMGHFETGQQFFFCYGGRIYFGMNKNNDSIDHRLVSQLPEVANSYIQHAPFPGTSVNSPTCFVIGNKGYISGGHTQSGTPVNQLWEYNFDTNVWVNKGNSPLGARAGAVVMVVGNKAYMGLGYDHIYLNTTPVKRYKKDWILYDPASPFFVIKASFPGEARAYAKGFVLEGRPYIGFGGLVNSSAGFSDLWDYLPATNTWVQQQSWTGTTPASCYNMNCFSLGSTGYAIRGSLIEFKRFSIL